jgi:hypothetical protein
VRGGVLTAEFVGGRLRVFGHYGVVTVSNAAGRVVSARNDFDFVVDGGNSPPRAAGVSDPLALAEIGATMTSGGHQHGGAAKYPTDSDVARLGVVSRRPSVEPPNPDLAADANRGSRAGTAPYYPTLRLLYVRGGRLFN